MDRLPDQLESEARVRHYVDGALVTARRGFNWPSGTTITDDPVEERVDLTLAGSSHYEDLFGSGYDATGGTFGAPTSFFEDAWEDEGWFSAYHSATAFAMLLGFQEHASIYVQPSDSGNNPEVEIGIAASNYTGSKSTGIIVDVAVQTGSDFTSSSIEAFADRAADSAQSSWEITANSDGASLTITPFSNQTQYLASLGNVLEIEPDGTVGGVTPSVGDQLTWNGTKIVWAAP